MTEPNILYNTALFAFVNQLQTEQQAMERQAGLDGSLAVYFETGRKYDKIILRSGANSMIRYFVEKSTGIIYGAKSRHAPNTKWYFGTIYTAEKWHWGDFHGVPINDESIRSVKSYGGYRHYFKV